MYSFERPKQRKMDVRFPAWNIWISFRTDSVTTVAREIVGVQEVRRDRG
jgi:hypothetical protein